jgi:hypothetical protein
MLPLLVATPARATTAAMIRMRVVVKTIMVVTPFAPGRISLEPAGSRRGRNSA